MIAVGLQPERMISWATALRYQALFTEAGGLAVGNDVTVVRNQDRLGLVVRTRERRCAGRLSPSTASTRSARETTAHIRTGTLLGERVLTLESAGSGTLHPPGHPDLPDIVAVFVDRGGQRADHQHGGHRHRHRSTSRWTRCRQTIDQVAPQLGPTFDGLTRLSQGAQQPQRQLWPIC